MVVDIKRFEIYLVRLNLKVGSEIQKTRLVKKIGDVDAVTSKEISQILVKMFEL